MGNLNGCSKGREKAAVNLDTARLDVSSARNAGAERWAPDVFSRAATKLKTAERDFLKGRYEVVETQAPEISRLALQAKAESEREAAAGRRRLTAGERSTEALIASRTP